jgi:hypothetical protein
MVLGEGDELGRGRGACAGEDLGVDMARELLHAYLVEAGVRGDCNVSTAPSVFLLSKGTYCSSSSSPWPCYLWPSLVEVAETGPWQDIVAVRSRDMCAERRVGRGGLHSQQKSVQSCSASSHGASARYGMLYRVSSSRNSRGWLQTSPSAVVITSA